MRCFVIAVALVAPSQASAELTMPWGASAVIEAYSRGVATADCAAVAPLSGVIARHPESRESLCETYAAWKKEGLVERLRAPSAILTSGYDRLIVIPNSRAMLENGQPAITNAVYLVCSKDGGRGWKVIDVGCDHLKDWAKGVYPAYQGRPKFDATVDHPENR